jgi:hypothetical protein
MMMHAPCDNIMITASLAAHESGKSIALCCGKLLPQTKYVTIGSLRKIIIIIIIIMIIYIINISTVHGQHNHQSNQINTYALVEWEVYLRIIHQIKSNQIKSTQALFEREADASSTKST